MAGESYVGTAYTFKTMAYNYELWMWGKNNNGQLGQNNTTTYSSPIQVGSGTDWTNLHGVNKVLYATLVDNTP